jgi:hypothetical protein
MSIKWKYLIEVEEAWRRAARLYASDGSNESFKHLIAALIRAGKLPKGKDSSIGEIDDLLTDLGVYKVSPYQEVLDAINNRDKTLQKLIIDARTTLRTNRVLRQTVLRRLVNYRRYSLNEGQSRLHWVKSEDLAGVHNYIHNADSYIRSLRSLHNSSSFVAALLSEAGMYEGLRSLTTSEQAVRDAFAKVLYASEQKRAGLSETITDVIESRDNKKLLKKLKALVDKPGTSGEGEAAKVAYSRVQDLLNKEGSYVNKASSREYKAPSNSEKLSGPGGMDVESVSSWRKLLNMYDPLVMRFVSPYSTSKWKKVHNVGVLHGKPALTISDYSSGSNRSLFLMSRDALKHYGIEFKENPENSDTAT